MFQEQITVWAKNAKNDTKIGAQDRSLDFIS